ncbi:saccharopine dehydrogenase NADP-binding domain-containing protein [Legionella cardiaca]|uniref:Saccharopine dehydrogenase NADP-binding domain-containing protein n=1 Tax=Legionella cardiaca TaxID=1071983 RepID=A0ABY8ASC5_9GAMM|nr:saccharopine dehydrogenase NADP-binding domain-containing protein [Legionella cardiaca]WED42669.1 saccharopine dehydrogenase NADP-binding domain-containing protein [Legionella cardiaca]
MGWKALVKRKAKTNNHFIEQVMQKSVLILGGYGNFGRRIAQSLCLAEVAVIIAGRDPLKAKQFCDELRLQYHDAAINAISMDVTKDIGMILKEWQPTVVINTCGPFQMTDYHIAINCIENGVNYIDLADGRDFVCGISKLDNIAKAHNVLVVSGASSVPGLSSAIVKHFQPEFTQINSLQYGIATVQKFSRGYATAKAILTYLGKPCRPPGGESKGFYGWQGLHRIKYPEMGTRWMGLCDVPDLDLLPQHFGIKKISFSAGMESSFLHLGMWLVSWLVRFGLPISLPRHTQFLINVGHCFDWQSSDDSGMHLFMKGLDLQGNELEIKCFILAKEAAGPHIPTVPAIILAKQLVYNQLSLKGALPCIALVSLKDYLAELSDLPIKMQIWRNDDLSMA